MGFEEGSYAGGVGLKLVPKDKRKRSALEIADLLRKEVDKLPELDWGYSSATSFIEQSLMGTGGKQFVVDITGSDLKNLRNVAYQIEELLKKIPGFIDVSSSIMPLRQEFNFTLNDNKAPFSGLNAAILGDTLRAYIDGKRVAYFRQDNEDIPIVIKIKDAENLTLNQLKSLSIPTILGNYQTISNITNFKQSAKEIKIEHKNRMRLYQVSANLRGISLGDAAKIFSKEMEKINLPAGVSWKISGEYEEQIKAFQALFVLLLLGIIFVYLIMAAQFESLRHPFYIMFSIPFAITGVLFLLFITGFTINLTSFIGMVMLIGIVVNNSIVYVDYVNQKRSAGMSLKEALIISGKHRLRPILMTWLTTFFGILPLALTRGEGSESYNPLGVAAIGGLLTSTIISLILIPSVYYVFELRKEKSRK
jgi:HAE1 family hydrophobic/amphiphilic exporter-1